MVMKRFMHPLKQPRLLPLRLLLLNKASYFSLTKRHARRGVLLFGAVFGAAMQCPALGAGLRESLEYLPHS